MFRLGIDLGGTKIEAIALADDGSELVRERITAPRGSYPLTLQAIAELVDSVEAAAVAHLGAGAARRPLGIGTPGAISPATGLMKNSNSTWLNGQPFLRDLQALSQRPVRIENDANCLAMSEASDGAAADSAVVFGVILGTGVGGGLVVHGRLVRGAMAVAGEWGHIRLPAAEQAQQQVLEWPGPRCYCGRDGCVETWLSGPGLLADHRRHDPNSGFDNAEAVIAAMRAGEPAARASFERYVQRLARALSVVINIVDPEVIVLGGGLSRVHELYDQLPGQLCRHVFSDAVLTRVVPALHGDSSGVRGAAWLWPLSAH
jgi:fructokinase